jgi:hypothetical protein
MLRSSKREILGPNDPDADSYASAGREDATV